MSTPRTPAPLRMLATLALATLALGSALATPAAAASPAPHPTGSIAVGEPYPTCAPGQLAPCTKPPAPSCRKLIVAKKVVIVCTKTPPAPPCPSAVPRYLYDSRPIIAAGLIRCQPPASRLFTSGPIIAP